MKLSPLARSAKPEEEAVGRGPGGVASLTGSHPLLPKAVGEHQRTTKFKDCADRYKARVPKFFTEPRPDFPETVHERVPCRGHFTEGCRSTFMCIDAGLADGQSRADTILDHIRLALKTGKSKQGAIKSIGVDPSVVLRFRIAEPQEDLYYVSPHSQELDKKTEFQAEFLEMYVTSASDEGTGSVSDVGSDTAIVLQLHLGR